jgi:hypothetical protein
MWAGLAANTALLVVASVLVADIEMNEEIVVLILTWLCVTIF